MYQGKRTKRSGGGLRKFLLLGAVLALVLAVSVSVTFAFLVDKKDTVTNVFEPVKVSCKISEKFDGNKKTEVTVENTGDIPAYIRVAVVVNKADDDGNIVAGTVEEGKGSFTPGTGWVKHKDGYYYYTSAVTNGESTENLIGGTGGIDLTGIRVTILAEAIQAGGGTGTETAVQDAWGVDPTTLGGANG